VELLLFDAKDDAHTRARDHDRSLRLTGPSHYWHAFVPGVKPGQLYGYRSPWDRSIPPSGMRFDPSKVLLDPYGRCVVVPKNYSRDAARLEGRQLPPRR
jgi:isoamylase